MPNKSERPGGPARALKDKRHDGAGYTHTDGSGTRFRFGPLRRRGARWALGVNGDTIVLTTRQLMDGPRGRAFTVKTFNLLHLVPPPLSRAEWEAIARALLAELSSRDESP
jgi:hypothetical protein